MRHLALWASCLWAFAVLAGGCRPSTEETTAAEPPSATEAPAGLPQGPGTTPADDGVAIAYTVRGEGEPALVFIHGWSCDQSYWSEQVDAFSDGHTVVTLDLAGHGASGKDRAEWRIASFGGDVKAVVDALGLGRVIFVGHSMGGPVALEAARLLPGRVAGVVGVDTFQDAGHRPDPDQWGELVAAYEDDFAGTCDRFVRSMFPEDTDAGLVEDTVGDLCDAPPAIATALIREFGEYDLAAVMSAVDAPVRAINGTLFPTAVEANREHAPGFEADLMEGTGHFPMLERPAEFNELLAAAVAALSPGDSGG